MSKKITPKKALITGISGSGASYLADYILDNHPDIELHGTTRSNSNLKNIENRISKINLWTDILENKDDLTEMLRHLKPDLIFHIASYANVRESWDRVPFVMENNIKMTADLLEAIRLAEIKPRIQICSTPEVYGQVDPKNIPINESCPINPSNPYAVSKFAQESLGYSYFKGYGLPIVITRMSTYLNPRRADLFATAFAMQVARIEAGLQKTLLHGNLESTRTILDARDCASAYWTALERGIPGQVYNIGGIQIVSVGEFLDILKKKAACPIPSEVDPKLLRPSDVTLQVIDSTKFMDQTGWKPQYTFEESVALLLEHCRREVKK
ncbi:MAG: GDP-mannose 4,6-dehydratase [Candidatus Yanofskybacteria bacterium]|nr:GDP-mannose 4,6-dehydratase [Candidatus Yanofskybacteria bacterium]